MKIKIEDIDVPRDRQRMLVSEERIQRKANSMRARGMYNDIIVADTDTERRYSLVAGFQRLEAARLLEWTEIDAKYKGDLTELERQLIELEENTLHDELTWAEESLAHERIHNLFVAEYGKAVPGYGRGQSIEKTALVLGISKSNLAQDIQLAEMLRFLPELGALGKKQALTKIALVGERLLREELAERMESATSRVDTSIFENLPGQSLPDTKVPSPKQSIFGQLILGNSLEVLKSMNNESVDLIVTDPPYGTSAARGGIQIAHKRPDGIDSLTGFLDLISEMYRVLRDGHLYVFMAGTIAREMMEALHKAGFIVRWMPLIVIKRNVTILDVDFDFGSGYHTVIFARKGQKPFSKRELISDVFTTQETVQSLQYSNQKPSDVICEFIEASSDPGDLVLDPFMGSGTTLVSAIRKGRKAIGIDLSSIALGIAKERIHKEFGPVVYETKFEQPGTEEGGENDGDSS